MAQISELTKALLKHLDGVERQLQPGDSVLVQPVIDGHRFSTSVEVPGYNYEQVHAELRRMVMAGLVSSGTATWDSAAYGIQFAYITDAGRRLMAVA